MGCQQRLRGAVNAVLSVGRSTGGRLERRRGQPGEVLPSGHSSGILRIGEAGDLRGGLRGSSLLRLLLDAHGTLLLPRRIEAAVADAVLLGHELLGDVSLGRGGAGLTLSRFGEASDHEAVGHTASIRHDLRRTNILELSDVIDRGALVEGLLEVPRERVGGVPSGTSNVEVQIAVEVLVTRILQLDHPVLVGHLPQQKGLTSHSFGRRHRLETDRALDVQR